MGLPDTGTQSSAKRDILSRSALLRRLPVAEMCLEIDQIAVATQNPQTILHAFPEALRGDRLLVLNRTAKAFDVPENDTVIILLTLSAQGCDDFVDQDGIGTVIQAVVVADRVNEPCDISNHKVVIEGLSTWDHVPDAPGDGVCVLVGALHAPGQFLLQLGIELRLLLPPAIGN